MKIIILCLAILFTIIDLNAQNNKLNLVDSLMIEYDSSSFAFNCVNSEYLYTSTGNSIIRYDLKNKEIHNEVIKKGRGPGETLIITDLSLDNSGTLYILDMNQAKIVLKDADFNTKQDIFVKAPLQMIGALPVNNDLYIHLPSWKITGSIFNKVDYSYKPAKLIPIAANETIPDKLTKNNLENLFINMGYYSVKNSNIYFLSKYSPNVKVYDTVTNSMKEYEFDSDVQEMEQQTYISDDGTRYSLPPSKADVLGRNIIVHPNDDNIVFINAYGRTANRSYFGDVLYVFDLRKGEIIDEVDIDIEIDNLSTYGNRLYVGKKIGNKEPYMIYVYEF